MASIFAEVPEAIANTLVINEMAKLKMEFPGPLLPNYQVPEEFSSPEEYLRHIARQGFQSRYPNPNAEAIQTVHGGEHTQIEAGASYGISPLCGDVFP